MPPKPWLYRQRLESLLQHRSVQDWLGRTPKKADFYIFQAYLKWRKEKGLDDDPDRWIEECLNGNNLTLVKHLRTLLEWAQGPSLDGLADISRIRYYCVVRAFYRKNFVSLPEANIKVRREASEVSQQITANQFDAMLRKVLEVGRLSVRDRAIMLTMRQGGMDDSTLALSFNFVGFPQLTRHFGTPDPSKWDEAKVPVRVDLVRPKTDYRYFTGLHRDAIAALKDYLTIRGTPRPRASHNLKSLPTSEPLFLSQTGGPISPEAVGVIYNESGKRAGINVRPEGLFEHTRDERAKMAQAAKNISALLDGKKIEGTDFNRELAEFLSHFGNIKGFLPERAQRLSESNAKMIRILAKTSWQPNSKEGIRQRLDGMLTFPIEYKGKLWKKISAQFMSQGSGVGVSVER